jgi:REP element-mobilizing transposase RayT
MAHEPHKHWHSRGYLPHVDVPGLIQFITFRLADSLPMKVLAEWKAQESISARKESLHPKIESYLDLGTGACHMNRPEIAKMVEDALLFHDGQRYRLLEWVIMPNHVHVLIETWRQFPLPDVIHSWKSFTTQACWKVLNSLGLKSQGAFWQRDYFDHGCMEVRGGAVNERKMVALRAHFKADRDVGAPTHSTFFLAFKSYFSPALSDV